MTRVTDLATSRQLMNYVGNTRRTVDDLQAQIASGATSTDYAGIARSSDRLVGLESTHDVFERFTVNNDRIDQHLAVIEDTLHSFRDLADNARSTLLDFGMTDRTDATEVRLMQEHAFKAMQALEALLNTEVNGRFLFSGTKVRTAAVDFGLTTLADFQAKWEGNTVTYPTTQATHLVNVELSHTQTSDLTFDRATDTITAATAGSLTRIPVGATIDVGGTGSNDDRYTVVANTGTVLTVSAEKLTFSEAAPAATLTDVDGNVLDAVWTGGLTIDEALGTITATNVDTLATLAVGTVVTLAGSPTPANDGTYTVQANDNTTLTIAQHRLTDETPAPNTSTITIQNYYRGDGVDTAHRVDTQHSFDIDLNAIDPIFEKVVRALGIIAQGVYGTEGGLDQHSERVNQALYLINSALEQAVDGTPPFGAEAFGNVADRQMEIGLHRVLIADTNERLTRQMGYFQSEISEIESADPTETSLQLFDQINALEASLATIARVQRLSLLNFL